MIGAFPPPTHGMSMVNQSMRSVFAEKGLHVQTIDLAPSASGKLPRVGRAWIALRGLFQFARQARKSQPTYMALSGGLGQIYELIFVLLARLARCPIVLHHHSFAYITRRSILMEMICRCAGKNTLHVVLSSRMASLLRSSYSWIENVLIISNAKFSEVGATRTRLERGELRTIGFLGNISPEKGIFTFLETLVELQSRNCDVDALIAGPFQSQAIENAVFARLSSGGLAKYVGPVFGDTKEAFFGAIDVLLFPSSYKNEAEPLTVHEALSCGVPVIASAVGCMPEVLDREAGAVLTSLATFPRDAADLIEQWRSNPDSFRRRSRAARSRFNVLRDNSGDATNLLVETLLGVTRPSKREQR
jgi:glycosyltransferase involved in cell wall biosynthesis